MRDVAAIIAKDLRKAVAGAQPEPTASADRRLSGSTRLDGGEPHVEIVGARFD